MRNVYLTIPPEKVVFTKRFADDSGDRLRVTFFPKRHDILIEDSDKQILVNMEDVEDLRTILDHCADMYKMAHPEPPKQQP